MLFVAEWKGVGQNYHWRMYHVADLLLPYEGDVNGALEPTPAAINSIKFRKVLYNRYQPFIVDCLDSLSAAGKSLSVDRAVSTTPGMQGLLTRVLAGV